MLLTDLHNWVQVSESPLIFDGRNEGKTKTYLGICPFCLNQLSVVQTTGDSGYIKAECGEHGEIRESMILLRGKK